MKRIWTPRPNRRHKTLKNFTIHYMKSSRKVPGSLVRIRSLLVSYYSSHSFPMVRLLEADVTNDTKSLNRCLDKHLMLVCQQRLGAKAEWLLPQAINVSGETMVETAKRALDLFSANRLEVKFLGNAPSAVYSYRYPSEVTKATQLKGAKIFFFKAYHLNGEFEPNEQLCIDHKWLNRKELSSLLNDKYWRSLDRCLFAEELDINDIMTRNKTFNRIVKKKFSTFQ